MRLYHITLTYPADGTERLFNLTKGPYKLHLERKPQPIERAAELAHRIAALDAAITLKNKPTPRVGIKRGTIRHTFDHLPTAADLLQTNL